MAEKVVRPWPNRPDRRHYGSANPLLPASRALSGNRVVRLTGDDGLERRAGDGDVAVLDHDHVLPGRHRRVAELVAVGHLGADERHLGRALDLRAQRPGAGVRRHHRELARLACTPTRHTSGGQTGEWALVQEEQMGPLLTLGKISLNR